MIRGSWFVIEGALRRYCRCFRWSAANAAGPDPAAGAGAVVKAVGSGARSLGWCFVVERMLAESDVLDLRATGVDNDVETFNNMDPLWRQSTSAFPTR